MQYEDEEIDEMEEAELRNLMVVNDHPVRAEMVDALKKVYAYIEGRFNGGCFVPGLYSCVKEYTL
eukprot:COSAG03_NODE_4396_length_1566_cov_126.217451_2_plen_65_part_00